MIALGELWGRGGERKSIRNTEEREKTSPGGKRSSETLLAKASVSEQVY